MTPGTRGDLPELFVPAHVSSCALLTVEAGKGLSDETGVVCSFTSTSSTTVSSVRSMSRTDVSFAPSKIDRANGLNPAVHTEGIAVLRQLREFKNDLRNP